MGKLLAEGIGTFCLVFAGCGAIVVDGQSGGALGHVGISVTFGLVVMAMIYAVGNISGAHLNPAVTIGFVLARRLKLRDAWGYLPAQLGGAFAAAGLLRVMFPAATTLGATLPGPAGLGPAVAMEAVLTFILMFVILNVSTGAMEKGIMAGVAVGGTIALAALMGGPVSGASMNPARSLAPAIVGGQWGHLWIYLTVPVVAAALASPTCRIIQGKHCCYVTPPEPENTACPTDA